MIKTIAATLLASTSPTPSHDSNPNLPIKNPSGNIADNGPLPENNSPYATLHPAPPGTDYTANTSPFGAILRGELPSLPLAETKYFYAFQDRNPRAPLHALVIPKQQIDSVLDLTGSPRKYHGTNDMYKNDAEMVTEMKEIALELLRTRQYEAYKNKDYILCFHIPPFYSVPHLHMHVLAPASEMSPFMRNGKYRTGSRWCVGVDYVLERLQSNKKTSLPYGYPFLKKEWIQFD